MPMHCDSQVTIGIAENQRQEKACVQEGWNSEKSDNVNESGEKLRRNPLTKGLW